MSIDLSIEMQEFNVHEHLAAISAILKDILGLEILPELKVTDIDFEAQTLQIEGEPSAVQVGLFSVPTSCLGPSSRHLSIAVAERTPQALALMAAVAVAAGTVAGKSISDDACLFGDTCHTPSSLLRTTRVERGIQGIARSSQRMADKFGMMQRRP